MNLHEECLLEYLKNPLNLFRSTEMLAINNIMIEEELIKREIKGKVLTAKEACQH